MPPALYQVDSFTDKLFGGNPAAVCILDEMRDTAWLQTFAAEMNLSETAYLVAHEGGFDLRWFTPTVEVDLCGHATLAAAHALWEGDYLPASQVARFHTRSGILTAQNDGEWIWLDFPATPPAPDATAPELIARALGIEPVVVQRSLYDYLVEVESESALRALAPDMEALAALGTRGVIVTSASRVPRFDFVSRYFAPGSGIPEDPVTGSAHCTLGPYWAAKTGKAEFTAFQASRRGGVVQVRLLGERVHLGGQAVTVFEGELRERSPSGSRQIPLSSL